jgi:hypothetical protein
MKWMMEIAAFALAAAGAAACALALPWMWDRLGAERLKSVWKWACIYVQAAEQIVGPGNGAQKKAYVLERMKGRSLWRDEETLDALVEAAVRELT